MEFWNKPARKPTLLIIAASLRFLSANTAVARAGEQAAQQPSAPTTAAARPVGTIQSISGNTITLTTDAGSDVTVQVQDATKLMRIAPGQKDLKDATPIQLADMQPGDRILVRGKLADDGKSVVAASVIAMKKGDIAEKQSRDREEWQKHGLGGLVNSVDVATNTINVALPSLGEKKSVVIHLSKDTILRRYAVDSVKFDDAKPAPVDQIKPGDQLRARGTRSADGTELTAVEIVSGTFRNISGTISAIDTSASAITIQDLVSKKSITVRITPESQLRKLPPPVAQRIAARLKGASTDAPSSATSANGGGPAASGVQSPRSNTPMAGGSASGGSGEMWRQGGGGTADLQQMIDRMPAAALADLQKGDAVMIVATEGTANGQSTVITLLGGVGPILEASPKSSASTILSPWSLSTGGGEAATP